MIGSKKTSQAIVSIKNVTKQYPLRGQRTSLLKRILGSYKESRFFALNKVDFDLHYGDNIGIVGLNGSGKTTLLKILAGIAKPTTGDISVNGKVVSLIDLEAGFHPELTGRENIVVNGLLVGLSRAQIKAKLARIIKFAGLGKFIDEPLFSYSEGMKFRLGFSVAIHAKPDAVLVDEKFAVGDKQFLKKAIKELERILEQGKAIVTVSHNLELLEANSSKIIWLDKGKIVAAGPPKRVMKQYRAFKSNNH